MTDIDLWGLLPEFQRSDDATRGYPLRALLDTISRQANVLHEDIDRLWDDMFIETCADWAIPYIGALVGTLPLLPVPEGARADVARTVYFRRRKGTVPMLEQLAAFTTGWPARAVPAFESLGWTQFPDHLRPAATGIDLHDGAALATLGSAFGDARHTADIRPQDGLPRWNLGNIGFHLWRLGAYQVTGSTPRRFATHPHVFSFSPLGCPLRLFNAAAGATPRPPAAGTDAIAEPIATPAQVPGPIRHADFHHDPAAYYPPAAPGALPAGLSILVDGRRIPAGEVACLKLDDWAQPQAAGTTVGIDVELGRFSFAAGSVPADGIEVEVAYGYGFAADIGGGPYRRPHLTEPGAALQAPAMLDLLPTGIQASLDDGAAAAADTAVLELPDSRTHRGDLRLHGPRLALALRSADTRRGHIAGNIALDADSPEHVVLDGLLIEGQLRVAAGSPLRRLTLLDCTLVPGLRRTEDGGPSEADAPSLLVAEGNAGLSVEFERCISGWLCLPDSLAAFTATDSILDRAAGGDPPIPGADPAVPGDLPVLAADPAGTQAGPPASFSRCTLLGGLHVMELDCSETLVTGLVDSTRRQHGCVRYSHLPAGSATAGQFRCQPALALGQRVGGDDPGTADTPTTRSVIRRLLPGFTSRRYGDPGYAQLADATAPELLAGAANHSEMGAFNSLFQPQREANLRTRLREYLPLGLDPGIIHET